MICGRCRATALSSQHFHTISPFSPFCGDCLRDSSHTKWPFSSICGDTRQRNRHTKFHFSSIWYDAATKNDIPNFTFLSFGMTRPPKTAYQIPLLFDLVCREPFSRHHNSRKVTFCGDRARGAKPPRRHGMAQTSQKVPTLAKPQQTLANPAPTKPT